MTKITTSSTHTDSTTFKLDNPFDDYRFEATLDLKDGLYHHLFLAKDQRGVLGCTKTFKDSFSIHSVKELTDLRDILDAVLKHIEGSK